MGQHNSFKKDIDMLSEAYHKMYGKGEVVEEGKLGAGLGGAGGSVAGGILGGAAGGPLGFLTAPVGAALGAGLGGAALSDEEGHDKTGHLSDRDLLDAVEKKGTAGDRLLDAAKKRLDDGESLTPHERDALARDQYEDEEGKIWSDEDAYEQDLDQKTKARDPEFKHGSARG